MAKRPRPPRSASSPSPPGLVADAEGLSVRSYEVGALPIVNHFLERMRLRETLLDYLSPSRRRAAASTADLLLVLVRNLLLSREPLYAVGAWANHQAPDLIGLSFNPRLNDDRLGRALDALFAAAWPTLTLAAVRRVVDAFQLRLDELHNDSTTVTFSGDYEGAATPQRRLGRLAPAITYGHNKDHRPDLKQLLYILTVTEDGGIPVHVQVASGNTADDNTHRQTWDLLRQLTQRVDFLYVADCKLASNENLRYIAGQGGRFISVWPATRREDAAFRQRLFQAPAAITWRWLYDVRDEHGEITDNFSVCEQEEPTTDGWRLYWYRSQAKQEHDARQRALRIQRAVEELTDLQRRLTGSRPRLREAAPVRQAVDEILERFDCADWLSVTVQVCEEERHRQVGPGRPGPNTRYEREIVRRCRLTWALDMPALQREAASDGVFPLVTNWAAGDGLQVLRAYKRQPRIEKRFSQLKTDFQVAPVWLKQVTRIEALLVAYFLALMTESLIERELRQAMAREGLEHLPLYPEGRACRRPTARCLFDAFATQQRHIVTVRHDSQGAASERVATTNLTSLQREVLRLLGIDPSVYRR